MKNKLLACLTLLLLTLGACSEKPKPQPAITITFACTQQDYAAYQSAAQDFNRANPDVQVRVLTWQQAGIEPFQAGGDTITCFYILRTMR
jgi:ABC-type glycerol-3-phosphate transport system substrate-binding protein